MKLLHKTLLVSLLLATPFVAVQAAESAAAHAAWIKAQKIDIQPTLKVTETKIPADSAGSSSSQTNPPPGSSMNRGQTNTPSHPNQAPSSPAQGDSMMHSGMGQSK
ncbi:MAG: hypothetical protein ABI228_00895 [Burkholderiaceae bacterium]